MTTPAAVRSLYIHVPFCRRRCGYCDFYKELFDAEQAEQVVAALLRELAGYTSAGVAFETVFIGGGTPTVLPPNTLARLLAGLAPHLAAGPHVEFTVEANPATVTGDSARVLAEHGVNRVSVGAQSFDAAELTALDRMHSPPQVAETLAACRQAGIDNLSVDLIFGIPGQTLASWRSSLDAALALQPQHMSCYGLTYEPGTVLHRRRELGQVVPVDPDTEADMFELAIDRLAAGGLAQYEISNYARPAWECRHNVLCWENQGYVGLGPSAAGYVAGRRYRNVADVAAYVTALEAGRSPIVETEQLDRDGVLRETAMLALRMRRGLSRPAFESRFKCTLEDVFREPIEKHVAAGNLELDAAAMRLTRAGLLVADRVMADFL